MKTMYISGKIRDKRGDYMTSLHTELARQFGACIWRKGWFAFVPHTSTEWMEGVVHYNMFLRGDLIIISRSDGVFMLPNWIDSDGAKLERRFAQMIGVPIYYDLKEVPQLDGVELDREPAEFYPPGMEFVQLENSWDLSDKDVYQSVFYPEIPHEIMPTEAEVPQLKGTLGGAKV